MNFSMNTLTDKQPCKTSKVIVGMSGGVDSSVAAMLLLEQGYVVEGLFMKNWEEDDGTEYCTAKKDLADAEAVCQKLNIKLHTANFASEYWDNVFEHFLSEYQAGRTPNPDILCNKEIKFKAFLEYAKTLGAELIATGHYVRKKETGNKSYLLKGLDSNKDQSYFLCAVAEEQISQSLFPLGELQKAEVRELAANHALLTHDKKDSTGICFIGERRFKDFLQTYISAKPGNIETAEGTVLGTHQGLMYHTLGQRQGLGIGGVKGSPEKAWYVAKKELGRNVLIVVQGNNHPLLFSNKLSTGKIHWINQQIPELPLKCMAKTRYRQADQSCLVSPLNAETFLVEFDQAQRALTPGQSVVFYDDDICLGGGVIEEYFQ